MFLWVLFLHNYIIPQKGCFLSFSGCSLFFCFFTAPFKFIQEFANSSDVNPECAAERFKSALIAGSDSVELPLTAVAVQLADDQRGFDREILGEVVAEKLLVSIGVVNANECIVHLTEILVAYRSVVNGYGERNAGDILRNLAEVDLYCFIVAVAHTVAVVAGMLN